MINFILFPFSYPFMQRGLTAAVIVGVLCSIVGCYVVLRGMAFLGDAIAHAILPGVAIAYLLNGNLTIGALIAAVLVGLGIGVDEVAGAVGYPVGKQPRGIGSMMAAVDLEAVIGQTLKNIPALDEAVKNQNPGLHAVSLPAIP